MWTDDCLSPPMVVKEPNWKLPQVRKIFFAPGFSPSIFIMVVLALGFKTQAYGDSPATQPAGVRSATMETGLASYYGAKYHGRPTASGELFNRNELTAAHPWLAFGTRVKVTHLVNGKSVTVRINDRGPFVQGRVIDLSEAAANELQMVKSGLAAVKLEIVE